jgi:hypothetical protein
MLVFSISDAAIPINQGHLDHRKSSSSLIVLGGTVAWKPKMDLEPHAIRRQANNPEPPANFQYRLKS